MAILSTQTTFQRRGTKVEKVLMYRVGKRVFENGYLRYSAEDQVDEEEARRLGILEEEDTSTQEDTTTDDSPSKPSVSDNKPEWEAYAKSLNIDTTGMSKNKIVEAVLEQEESSEESDNDDDVVDDSDGDSSSYRE